MQYRITRISFLHRWRRINLRKSELEPATARLLPRSERIGAGWVFKRARILAADDRDFPFISGATANHWNGPRGQKLIKNLLTG
jgi:hypothetical protein